MNFDPGIKIGDKISNDELVKIFRCGNMGGMRRSKTTGTLVIISDETKGLYKDQWKDGVLHYVGMGKVGDQVLEGNQNSTLFHSNTNDVEVHLFEVRVPREYVYHGVVKLVDHPYKTPQRDDNGNMRAVWVFPVASIEKLKEVKARFVAIDQLEDEKLKADVGKLLSKEVEVGYVHVSKPREKSEPIIINNVEVARRDRKTALNALSFAKHLCEINRSHPTFLRRRTKINYMEPHHLIPLAYSAEFSVSLDVEENIVCLCSNCHNQLHYGEGYEKLLWELYQSRKAALEKVGIVISFERLKEMYQ